MKSIPIMLHVNAVVNAVLKCPSSVIAKRCPHLSCFQMVSFFWVKIKAAYSARKPNRDQKSEQVYICCFSDGQGLGFWKCFDFRDVSSRCKSGIHPRAESFDPRHMLDGMQTVKAPAE